MAFCPLPWQPLISAGSLRAHQIKTAHTAVTFSAAVASYLAGTDCSCRPTLFDFATQSSVCRAPSTVDPSAAQEFPACAAFLLPGYIPMVPSGRRL